MPEPIKPVVPEPKPEPKPNPDPSPKPDDKKGNKEMIPKASLDAVSEKLREKTKKLKEFEDAKTKAEEDKLKEDNKYKELAEKRERDIEKLTKAGREKDVRDAVKSKLQEKGVTGKMVDTAYKLLDLSTIETDKDGNVTGVTEAVGALIKENDFLVKQKRSFGGGTNPTDVDNAEEFTLSQIGDPVFYQKNRKAIEKAMTTGKIINDRA